MMMNLYHGSNRERGEKIIRNEKFPVSRGDNHWLGDGSYFFIQTFYAYKWIVDMYKRRIHKSIPEYEALIESYLIININANWNIDKIFDLTNPEHKILFDIVLKEMKSKGKIQDNKMPEGVVINYMFKELAYDKDYYAVRALFIQNQHKYKFKNRLGYMPQEQICIRNPSIVQHIEEYNFAEKVSSYNKMMIDMYYDNIIIERKPKYEYNKTYTYKFNRE